MDEVKIIRHVTLAGLWINAALTIVKIVTGIYGHSDALVADGVHSVSDLATDLVVLFFVGIAYKSADEGHPYGHGKFETFATLLIAIMLFCAAIGIGVSGVRSAVGTINGKILHRPDFITLAVAALSIISKELLFRYTMRKAHKTGSSSLTANAWHHRSDAFSSIATLAGVSAAFFLGDRWLILDPLTSVLISFFIAWSAIKVGLPSINELLEKSLPEKEVRSIESAIKSVGGVKAVHRLRSRRNGHSYVVDTHIKVDPDITVTQGHAIATAVENELKKLLGNDVVSYVHVEPYYIPANEIGRG